MGSSASKSRGRVARARASSTRRRSPAASSCGSAFRAGPSPTSTSAARARSRASARPAPSARRTKVRLPSAVRSGRRCPSWDDDAEAPAQPRQAARPERPHLHPVHEDGAPRRALLTRDEAEQGRLAGAARADHDGQLGRLDLEGEIHQRLDAPARRAPVDLGDATELQHGPTVIIGTGVGGPAGFSRAGRGAPGRRRTGRRQPAPRRSARSRLTTWGLAFPWVAFMTWPTRKPAACFLPRRIVVDHARDGPPRPRRSPGRWRPRRRPGGAPPGGRSRRAPRRSGPSARRAPWPSSR